jgi:hypothetical protein
MRVKPEDKAIHTSASRHLSRTKPAFAKSLPTVNSILGWVSALDSEGRTIWIADADRDDGKRFVVRADEKLTAFVELEAAIRDWATC